MIGLPARSRSRHDFRMTGTEPWQREDLADLIVGDYRSRNLLSILEWHRVMPLDESIQALVRPASGPGHRARCRAGRRRHPRVGEMDGGPIDGAQPLDVHDLRVVRTHRVAGPRATGPRRVDSARSLDPGTWPRRSVSDVNDTRHCAPARAGSATNVPDPWRVTDESLALEFGDGAAHGDATDRCARRQALTPTGRHRRAGSRRSRCGRAAASAAAGTAEGQVVGSLTSPASQHVMTSVKPPRTVVEVPGPASEVREEEFRLQTC